MTDHQLILALEAALCAIEGHCPVDMQPLVNQLHEKIDHIIASTYGDKEFGKFLDDQCQAVRALANNPAVFGGETGVYGHK